LLELDVEIVGRPEPDQVREYLVDAAQRPCRGDTFDVAGEEWHDSFAIACLGGGRQCLQEAPGSRR